MTVELSPLEREARTLIEGDRAAADFSSHEQVVRMVFSAMWASAIEADRVVAVGCAMVGFENSDDTRDAIKSALGRLVRRKVLRTRRAQGKTLYELALS